MAGVGYSRLGMPIITFEETSFPLIAIVQNMYDGDLQKSRMRCSIAIVELDVYRFHGCQNLPFTRVSPFEIIAKTALHCTGHRL